MFWAGSGPWQSPRPKSARLHSLPGYYGQTVALFTAVPAILLMAAWLFLQPLLIENQVSAQIPDSVIPEGGNLSLVMADVRRIAEGLDLDR